MDKYVIDEYFQDGKKIYELCNETTQERLIYSEYQTHIERLKNQFENEG